MTPPDPATPSPLEALLKEVDKLAPWQAVTGAPFVPVHVRLAAIVRVLRDAVVVLPTTNAAWKVAAAALRRADEIAGGGA